MTKLLIIYKTHDCLMQKEIYQKATIAFDENTMIYDERLSFRDNVDVFLENTMNKGVIFLNDDLAISVMSIVSFSKLEDQNDQNGQQLKNNQQSQQEHSNKSQQKNSNQNKNGTWSSKKKYFKPRYNKNTGIDKDKVDQDPASAAISISHAQPVMSAAPVQSNAADSYSKSE